MEQKIVASASFERLLYIGLCTTWRDIQKSYVLGIINAVLDLRWTYSHQQEKKIQEAEDWVLAA